MSQVWLQGHVAAASRAEVNSTAMKEVGRLLVEQSLDKVLGRLRDVLPGLACEGRLLCQDGLPAPMCVRVGRTTSCSTCQNCFSAAVSTLIRQTFTVPQSLCASSADRNFILCVPSQSSTGGS